MVFVDEIINNKMVVEVFRLKLALKWWEFCKIHLSNIVEGYL